MASLLKVSASATILIAYSQFAASRTPPGHRRFLALLPAIPPLFLLPLLFPSLHLRSISAFFLAWLAVFKLLLLSVDSGPLSPSLPFLTFLPVALLPIKLCPNSPPHKPKSKPPLLPTAIKALLLSLLTTLYSRRDNIPHHLLLAVYSLHIYLALNLVLAAAALLALRFDLEPQFNAPYLSTSLQEFWGRRWNLMVTAILRPAVYAPVRARWGAGAGIAATFVVSGVMHELMFFYVTLEKPTGEVLSFFVLQGVCTALERWVVKGGGGERGVGRGVRRGVTLGFVAGTGFWLFFPQVVRSGADVRAVEETVVMMRVLEGGVRGVLGWLGLEMNGTEARIW